MRAFFAVDLDEVARQAASRAARSLRSASRGPVSWVRPENYHVTLRFLGEIPPERAESLAARAGAAVAPVEPFDLRLGGPHPFPSPRRPRVVVLDLTPEEPLLGLARRVEEAVVEAGFAAEERPLRAHLTLGRVRNGARAPRVDPPPAPTARFAVRDAVLFQSELHSSGARYTALGRAALGEGHPS